MKIYVSQNAFRSGDGSKDRPFKSINEAALIAQPGDEVIVGSGVYREYVDPKNAGTEDARIVYRSEEPLGAVITGAEEVKGWKKYEGDTWVVRIGNGVFGSYNPYTVPVAGDWYFAPDPVHTGSGFFQFLGPESRIRSLSSSLPDFSRNCSRSCGTVSLSLSGPETSITILPLSMMIVRFPVSRAETIL